MVAEPHFTYEPEIASTRLCQGDLIKRTPELETLLKDVHPHYFSKADYRHFLVLTQSCDLMRRDGEDCSSPYITLAAVRPLRLAVEREAKRIQFDEIERVLSLLDFNRKERLVQFVERLLNNNEDKYFFLCREPAFGLNENQCAFLQLSIALKAPAHYETLLSAKVLQLTESFQHKLGYLVGKLYSRVGTEDWLPDKCSGEEFRRASRQPVDDLNSVVWVDPQTHGKALKAMKPLEPKDVTIEKYEEIVLSIKSSKAQKREQLLSAMADELERLGVSESDVQRARDRLRNNEKFNTALK